MALFARPTPDRIRAVLELRRIAVDLRFQALVPGVDNIRHDAYLSPAFVKYARTYILQLFVKHSTAGELLQEKPPLPSPQDRNEFKRLLQEVLLQALSQAKASQNPEIDLLANVAVVKYLGWELQQQYARIIFEGKNKLKMYEGPRHERNLRAFQLKETFSEFQTNKKNWLRRVSNELLMLTNEVQADVVRKTRESFFGAEAGRWFAYFSNPLMFTDSGRDDYIQLNKYVMLGNFHRDPDLYESVARWLKSMLRWVDQTSPEARELEAQQQEHARLAAALEQLRQQAFPQDRSRGFGRLFGSKAEPPALPPPPALVSQIEETEQKLAQSEAQLRVAAEAYDMYLDDLISLPENFEELLGMARTEQALAEARSRKAGKEEGAALEEKLGIQQYLLDEFYSSAQQVSLLPCIAAAYETGRVYQDYCPPINPQQLKHALLDPAERKKVAALISYYKLSRASEGTLEEAAGRVRACSARDLKVLLLRFILDFARHQHDTRLLQVFQGLVDRVNLQFDEKTRELSRINSTLYEFLLTGEQKPQDDRVIGHVILKADVRDSTRMTAQLFARGLNPASHFSLNFFDPLNKLFARYNATKVFIEGDAVIVALFETANAPMGGYPMARACGLAREMMEVVRAYNARAENTDLPRLDIGIGICWQNSAPMYLLDGENRVMISSAINLADRLSGCSKLARRALADLKSLFNVFVFQTISDEAAAGEIDEFLVRFNTGVCMSEDAFRKLQQEISLRVVETEFATLWNPEKVRLYCGSFPLSNDVFQRLVIREAAIAFVEAHDFSLKCYTDRNYYEVCTNHRIYEYTEKLTAASA